MATTKRNVRHPPHYGVFARLAPSKIHGVGVFAITDIKKGTRLFYDDTLPIRRVRLKDVESLPLSIRRLYEDFAVLEKKTGKYACPETFNRLTISWYLNHSRAPNVRCNKKYEFFALRDINLGEELTTDYATYGAFAPGQTFK